MENKDHILCSSPQPPSPSQQRMSVCRKYVLASFQKRHLKSLFVFLWQVHLVSYSITKCLLKQCFCVKWTKHFWTIFHYPFSTIKNQTSWHSQQKVEQWISQSFPHICLSFLSEGIHFKTTRIKQKNTSLGSLLWNFVLKI